MSSMLQDMIHTVSVHVEKVKDVVDKMETRINGMADHLDDMGDDLKAMKNDHTAQRERITKIEAIQARPGDVTINNQQNADKAVGVQGTDNEINKNG